MKYTEIMHAIPKCLDSALFGGGCLGINYKIRKQISILRKQYHYNYYDMQDVRQDIFIYFIEPRRGSSRIVDRYDSSKSKLQVFVNGVVLNYLRNLVRQEEARLKLEGEHLSYDTVMDRVVEGLEDDEEYGGYDYTVTTTTDPEEQVIEKELIESFSPVELTYLDYLAGNMTRVECMEYLGISKATFHRRYNRWKKRIEITLESQGLVN